MHLLVILIIILVLVMAKKLNLLKYINFMLLVLIVTFLTVSIILFPKEAVEAAKNGVDTWFNIVFPALLPFFIGAELLVGLGVVTFIGILLEPLIRPLFNVPGEGSFVFAMSITSGYPVGVKLTTKLREQGIVNKDEAQRLLSFCSTSGPLFMIGAVAIGMFHNPQLGTVISISHYLGAIVTGLLFRFYKMKNKCKSERIQSHNYFSRAFQEMFNTYRNHNKSFGLLIGEAVKNAMETMLAVGGFIILFSVIIRILQLTNIIQWFSYFLSPLFSFLGLESTLHAALISGIFEITIGCKIASDIGNVSFLQQAIFATMVISWSGISIHAQSISILGKSDLHAGIYIGTKFLHAVLSAIMVFFVSPLVLAVSTPITIPVILQYSRKTLFQTWIHRLLFSSSLFLFIVITLCFLGVLYLCSLRFKNMIKIKK